VESIDVHFQVVPPDFLNAVRRGTFRQVVEIERRSGRECMLHHAPEDVVVEPDTGVDPRLSDQRLVMEGWIVEDSPQRRSAPRRASSTQCSGALICCP
jgi:hypothetical protein